MKGTWMNMLLRDMMIPELIKLFEKHSGLSSAPHLVDPEAKERARQTAKENGVWEHIEKELDPTKDIPVLKRSDHQGIRNNDPRCLRRGFEHPQGMTRFNHKGLVLC